MSEYQMEQLLDVLRNMRADINNSLECIALCMVLNVITNNGDRNITAQERRELLNVLNGEEDMNIMLRRYLTNALRPRTCGGDKK